MHVARFEVQFFDKLAHFLNHGLSGVMGQLLHLGSTGVMTANASSLAAAALIGVYTAVVTFFAVLLTVLMGILPGDTELIELPAEVLATKIALIATQKQNPPSSDKGNALVLKGSISRTLV